MLKNANFSIGFQMIDENIFDNFTYIEYKLIDFSVYLALFADFTIVASTFLSLMIGMILS